MTFPHYSRDSSMMVLRIADLLNRDLAAVCRLSSYPGRSKFADSRYIFIFIPILFVTSNIPDVEDHSHINIEKFKQYINISS